jgi:hypothetical protein
MAELDVSQLMEQHLLYLLDELWKDKPKPVKK